MIRAPLASMSSVPEERPPPPPWRPPARVARSFIRSPVIPLSMPESLPFPAPRDRRCSGGRSPRCDARPRRDRSARAAGGASAGDDPAGRCRRSDTSAGSSTWPSATMEPRFDQSPGAVPASPNTITVPAIMPGPGLPGDVARDDEESAPHPEPGLGPGVSPHHDLAAGHTPARLGRRAAGAGAGVARSRRSTPPAMPSPGLVADASLDDDLAFAEAGTEAVGSSRGHPRSGCALPGVPVTARRDRPGATALPAVEQNRPPRQLRTPGARSSSRPAPLPGRPGPSSGFRSRATNAVAHAGAAHDLAQMKMVGAELAAVVAGGDGDDAVAAGRVDAGPHRRGDRLRVDAVDHDLQHRVHAVGQLRSR